MTSKFDILLKSCDEVLERERRMTWVGDDGSTITLAEAMGYPPDPAFGFAKALKAVAEALEEQRLVATQDIDERPADVVDRVRAAIERRLKEGK